MECVRYGSTILTPICFTNKLKEKKSISQFPLELFASSLGHHINNLYSWSGNDNVQFKSTQVCVRSVRCVSATWLKCVSSVLLVLSEVQVWFKCVLIVFQMCFKCASNVFQICFKCASNVLQMCFECVFQVCFNYVLNSYHVCLSVIHVNIIHLGEVTGGAQLEAPGSSSPGPRFWVLQVVAGM